MLHYFSQSTPTERFVRQIAFALQASHFGRKTASRTEQKMA
jgi:hypothetical protein